MTVSIFFLCAETRKPGGPDGRITGRFCVLERSLKWLWSGAL